MTRPSSWHNVPDVADRGDKKRDVGADPHLDLAGALHDVSNALTVLLGWVGEARASEASPDTIAYALKIIEQRARTARDLARQAIGGSLADVERPLGAIANEVAVALRVEASHSGATITVKGADHPAIVAGTLDVSQVLTNLVLNALAYAPGESEVELEITADDERCRVVVSDHGPGVPASRRDGIFHGESLRPGGTGVGLRHSRALARARGGDLELLASRPQAGARFRLSWPRADVLLQPPAPTPSVIPAARGQALDGVRVLLVEDDIAVIQLLETALEGRGAEVTVAKASKELTAALATGPFQAALVDLSPIADDVRGAIARLRSSSPGLDLVLITGSADRLPDAVATENIKLVRKPFELSEVLAALAKKP
jgi:CheY-like chemotaxis protein/anti-sigma regulatory factor (Ser/Thr protein kinase)